MPNLIEQTPEAQDFIAAASADVSRYKRFPEENFAEVHAGVLATNAVDLQNDQLSVEALESMATHINTHSLWMTVEHNPLIPPIGRVLVAKLFYSKEVDLYFLAGVIATYDSNSYLSFSDLGIDPQLDDEAVVDLPEAERATFASISFNPHEIEDSVIAEMCEHAPAFVDQEPTLTFRKSAEPKVILEIAASLWLLCQNPFLKKFLERYGERSADASLVFLSWLKTEVFPRLTRSARDPLFVLHFAHKDCRVEFIVPSNDVIVLASASESVHTAIPSAVMVVEKLAHLRVERVVYEYHVTSARWLPRFAVTQYGGILSDRRWLIALDRLAASLSIGARQKPGAD